MIISLIRLLYVGSEYLPVFLVGQLLVEADTIASRTPKPLCLLEESRTAAVGIASCFTYVCIQALNVHVCVYNNIPDMPSESYPLLEDQTRILTSQPLIILYFKIYISINEVTSILQFSIPCTLH